MKESFAISRLTGATADLENSGQIALIKPPNRSNKTLRAAPCMNDGLNSNVPRVQTARAKRRPSPPSTLALVLLLASVLGCAPSANYQRPASHATPSPTASIQTRPVKEDHSGATAKCRDGSLSYSQHRRGTCSHHGGVATWY